MSPGANGIIVGGRVSNGAVTVSSFSGDIVNIGRIFAGHGIVVGGLAEAGFSGAGAVTVSTFSGDIVNAGVITALTGHGILVGGVANAFSANASVMISAFAGNISNAGTITAHNVGIFVGGTAYGSAATVAISSFSGSIANSGTISAQGGGGPGVGIWLGGFAVSGGSVRVSNFSGGISNNGRITARDAGIFVGGSAELGGSVMLSTFAGGISNSGLISVRDEGIFVGGASGGTGGVVTITTFAGGISNSGTVSASLGHGILVGGTGELFSVGIATFTNGISNSGIILSSLRNGIFVGGSAALFGSIAISNFAGGVTNSGTISGANGIVVGGTAHLISSIMISTFGGGISNSGTIVARRAGIEVGGFASSNSSVTISIFSGGITNSGTISMTSAPGDGIFLGGTAVNNSSFALSIFAGSIVNAGTIVAGASGDGIQISNVSTFLGGITNTGSIIAGVGIAVTNAGAVSIYDAGFIAGASGIAVDLRNAGPGNIFTLSTTYSFGAGTEFVLGSGSDTFQLGGTGVGTFNLANVGTQYLGFTTFNVVGGVWNTSGTFDIGMPLTWNVLSGTLAGASTFGTGFIPVSIAVANGGTLEPGNIGQPGTFMTINGNLTFQPGATYLVNLSPNAASRTNVSGAVTLNGAAVEGILTAGIYSNKTYDILDPTSISGRFSGFTALNAPGFGGNLTYNGNSDVLLSLTAQLGVGGGLNINQQNVANDINNYFNNGGALPANFFPLFELTGSASGNSLTQLDGEVAVDAEKGAFELTNEFLSLMLDPFVYGRGGAASGGGPLGFAPDQQANLPPDVALAYAGVLKAPPRQSVDQRWTVWGAGFGGTGTANGDPNVGSNILTASTYGFAAGADYHVSPDTVLGFAAAGSGTNWSLAQSLGTGRSDAFQAGVYGTRYFGPAYIGAALAFTNNWFTTNRIAAAGDQLTASFNGQSFGARVESGYRYAMASAVGVTPYAAIQAQSFHTPTYSETDLTGGGFGLTYNAMTATDTRSELGARFDALTAWGAMPVQLRARLAWAHDWVSNPALNAAFQALPGSSFVINGAAMPQNSALTSVGAELHLTSRWTVIGKFDGEFASSAQTYAGSGTLRYQW